MGLARVDLGCGFGTRHVRQYTLGAPLAGRRLIARPRALLREADSGTNGFLTAILGARMLVLADIYAKHKLVVT